MALTDRWQAAQSVMAVNKGLPERLASAEAALNDMRDHLASINGCLADLPERLGTSMRLANRGMTQITLVGTKPRRIDDWEAVVGISAYVVGGPVAAPGISLQFGNDAGNLSPTFQQVISGPIQSVETVQLATDPGVPVIVQLFTSWVGGWQVW